MTYSKLLSVGAAALVLGAAPIHAGQPYAGKEEVAKEVVIVEEKSLCDTLFGLPTLYKDKNNPFIQKFALIGRYHGQYFVLDSNQGNADDWENRRARLGATADFFDFMKLSFQFNLDVDGTDDRFFKDLEDATLQFKVSDAFKLSVGKQKAPITNEWRTSSNSIVTFERSNIVNTVVPNKMGGVLASYSQDGFLLDLGAYSNTVDDDWAAPNFDGGISLFASIGYKADGVGTTRLEYLFSDIDRDASENVTRGFEHVFSLNHSNKWGNFGLIADTIYAVADDAAGDLFGVIIIPTYDITDNLKLVTRYQFITGDGDDSVSLGSRYEREASDLITRSGDTYHALYAGLNYYICGNNLKLMTGVEYANFDQTGGSSYNSWTWYSGVRVSF